MSDPTVYSIPDMSCDHCVHRISDALGAVPGVDKVTVDLGSKTATVEGGDDSAVRAAIAEAGYAVA